MIEIKRKKIIEVGDFVRINEKAPNGLAIKKGQDCVVINITKEDDYPYLIKNAYAETCLFKEEELEVIGNIYENHELLEAMFQE